MHANGVAGLQAIQSVSDRIENIDLTDIVSGKNEFAKHQPWFRIYFCTKIKLILYNVVLIH